MRGFLVSELVVLKVVNFVLRTPNNPVPNVDLPAMCSPKFKPGPPTEEAQVLSDRLNEILTMFVLFSMEGPYYLDISFDTKLRSKFLPLTTLCIEPGKSVWVLYVDATCINYDGNAFDATLLAMTAALRNSMPLHVFLF
jgi:exosome complex component RRP43